MKIRKGDKVKVISGKDKGKQGEVLFSIPSESKVIVKGVNVVTRHRKETGNKNNPGGRIQIEAPIHASNVMLVQGTGGKTTRVGFKVDEKTGKKTRISRKTGKSI